MFHKASLHRIRPLVNCLGFWCRSYCKLLVNLRPTSDRLQHSISTNIVTCKSCCGKITFSRHTKEWLIIEDILPLAVSFCSIFSQISWSVPSISFPLMHQNQFLSAKQGVNMLQFQVEGCILVIWGEILHFFVTSFANRNTSLRRTDSTVPHFQAIVEILLFCCKNHSSRSYLQHT